MTGSKMALLSRPCMSPPPAALRAAARAAARRAARCARRFCFWWEHEKSAGRGTYFVLPPPSKSPPLSPETRMAPFNAEISVAASLCPIPAHPCWPTIWSRRCASRSPTASSSSSSSSSPRCRTRISESHGLAGLLTRTPTSRQSVCLPCSPVHSRTSRRTHAARRNR